MNWIETINEPITKLDLLYGIGGYLIYKWGMISIEVVKVIYKKNVKDDKG
jgi:hypothetical protein